MINNLKDFHCQSLIITQIKKMNTKSKVFVINGIGEVGFLID